MPVEPHSAHSGETSMSEHSAVAGGRGRGSIGIQSCAPETRCEFNNRNSMWLPNLGACGHPAGFLPVQHHAYLSSLAGKVIHIRARARRACSPDISRRREPQRRRMRATAFPNLYLT